MQADSERKEKKDNRSGDVLLAQFWFLVAHVSSAYTPISGMAPATHRGHCHQPLSFRQSSDRFFKHHCRLCAFLTAPLFSALPQITRPFPPLPIRRQFPPPHSSTPPPVPLIDARNCTSVYVQLQLVANIAVDDCHIATCPLDKHKHIHALQIIARWVSTWHVCSI